MNAADAGTAPARPGPAARAGAPSDALQIGAVAAGPLAWTTQLLVNYVIAANACFDRGAASFLARPGWEGARQGPLAVNIAAIAITLAAVACGARAIRWARAHSMGQERHARSIARSHALGVAAVLFGVAFFIATVFTLIAIAGAPQCPL